MPCITILCSRPGFRRAGISHPAKKVYPADAFTDRQLAALKAEPVLTVVEGEGKQNGDKPDKIAKVSPPAAAAETEGLTPASPVPSSTDGKDPPDDAPAPSGTSGAVAEVAPSPNKAQKQK